MRNVTTVFVILALAFSAAGQDKAGQEKTGPDQPKPQSKPAPSQAELIKKLEKDLTGVKLVGRFTVTGRGEMTPKDEEYTISSATRLDDPDNPDLWLLKARVKYGKTDGVFPIPLEIKWAGDTPIITLTDLEIPGLGTFSSRVVIYEGRYAGTWQHGEVGGHLFGVLKRDGEGAAGQADPPTDKPKAKPADPQSK